MPKLAKEWHKTKNGNLTPDDITTGSHTKVWWKCSNCGYSWQTEVRRRAKGLGKCPRCARKKKSTSQLEFDFDSKN